MNATNYPVKVTDSLTSFSEASMYNLCSLYELVLDTPIKIREAVTICKIK